MGCDELFFTIADVQNWINQELMNKNRTGELNDYLASIGYLKKENEEDSKLEDDLGYLLSNTSSKGYKILVIGESSCDEKDLKGVAKSLGLSKDQVVFELGYTKLKNRSIQAYRYSNEYSDIIVGPTPHKTKGIEDNSSLIAEIENNQEKYPKLTRMQEAGGKLKISKTAFKEALMKTKAYQFML